MFYSEKQETINVREIKLDDTLYQQERELRNSVLLRPIGVPDYSWEMNDRDSLHFVAIKSGNVVGCVLLNLAEKPGTARLMQMAVAQNFQKQGIGKDLIDFLLATAKMRELKEITCHARAEAVAFYLKNNFIIEGEPFEEVGIKHFHMRLVL